MCATVSGDSVHKPTRAPRRAAANAASQPAWPAPITMTSKRFITTKATMQGTKTNLRVLSSLSFPDAKPRKNVRQQIVARPPAGDLLERRARVLQIGEHEFLGQRAPSP